MAIRFRLFTFFFAFSTLFSFLQFNPVHSCTTISLPLEYGSVAAENFDWESGHGLVVINPRGVHKRSVNLLDLYSAAKWKSKYGSLTFNQVAMNHPMSGMNEKGLFVNVSINLGEGKLSADQGASVDELEWVQVQLDQYSSTREVLAHLNDVVVRHVFAELHYMVCDESGECAVIEVDGNERKLKSVSGAAMSVRALANNPYLKSLHELRELNAAKMAGNLDDRFQLAASQLDHLSKLPASASANSLGVSSGLAASAEFAVELSLGILSQVKQGDFTRWQIVYDLANKKLVYRKAEQEALNSLNLSDLDFAQGSKFLARDMSDSSSVKFHPFTQADHEFLVSLSSKYLEGAIPADLLERLKCSENFAIPKLGYKNSVGHNLNSPQQTLL